MYVEVRFPRTDKIRYRFPEPFRDTYVSISKNPINKVQCSPEKSNTNLDTETSVLTTFNIIFVIDYNSKSFKLWIILTQPFKYILRMTIIVVHCHFMNSHKKNQNSKFISRDSLQTKVFTWKIMNKEDLTCSICLGKYDLKPFYGRWFKIQIFSWRQ